MSKTSSCRLAAFKAARPSKPTDVVNEAAAKRVLTIVDFGLPSGLGYASPGKMCVEAAVSFSMGYGVDDQPKCVLREIADYKISLNDRIWSGPKARAAGLRAVAIAQLGSNTLTNSEWREAFNFVLQRRLFNTLARLTAGDRKLTANQSVALSAVLGALDATRAVNNVYSMTYLISKVEGVPTHVLGYKGKDAFNRFAADVALDAMKRAKTKGSRYLYLLETGGKLKKRSNKKGKK